MRRWRIPLLGAVVGLLAVVAYVVVVSQPRRDEMATITADVDALRAQQGLLARENQALEEVAARAGEVQGALDRLEELIPSGLAQDALLTQLEAAAGETGVKLASVTFDDPQIPEGAPASEIPGAVLVEMAMTAAVDGPFAGVTELLHRVEADAGRAVLVGAVALTEAEAGFPAVTGTWSGRAYALLPADDPLLVDPDAPAEPPAGAAGDPAAAGATASPREGT